MRRALQFCIFLIFVANVLFAKSARVPLINQPLVPVSTQPGGKGFTLTVNGTGFASGAVVQWNGSPRVTQDVSSHQLKATIKPSDVATAGTASVTVVNPGKPGRTSNVVYFPVRKAAPTIAFATSTQLTPQGAVAVGDFNNDGKLDVVVGSGSTINVYLGDGHGRFSAPIQSNTTISYANFMVAGDFNNDGKLDLVVTDSIGGVASLLGDGTGSLQEISVFGGAPGGDHEIAMGDLNGDGNLDVVVIEQDEGSGVNKVFLGNGDGTFTQMGNYYAGIGSPALGDFNGDGILDLAIPNGDDENVDVFIGNGDGTFQSPQSYQTPYLVRAVAVADVNGDGVLDLITNGVSVLLGNGDGTFSLGTSIQVGFGGTVVLGDVNGDGKLDVVVGTSLCNGSCYATVVDVSLGDGNGHFQKPVEIPVGNILLSELSMGDFNRDGRLDLVMGSPSSPNVGILLLQTTVSLTPNSLAFGNQNVGTRSQPQAVTLKNIGDTALQINGIKIITDPQDFAQRNNCQSSLPPGGHCKIEVTFKPTQQGPLAASLQVSYRGIDSPQLVSLSGTGVAATVSLDPAKLTFLTQLVGTKSPTQTATLTNTGSSSVTISNISATAPFVQTNNCPSSLTVGSSCQISVKFEPTVKGPAKGKLSVQDDAEGSPQTVALSGTATVVKLSVFGVNFGDQKVGTKSAPVPIQLTNEGKTVLSISQIKIVGADAADFAESNNCGSSVPAGGSCTIKVRFQPQARGQRAANLEIADDGGGSPQKVGLSGTGT
jgi:hypothetical protein